jgi:hypothetical protein
MSDADRAAQERFETEQVNNLMIAELGHWGEALSQSEESGEGRVTIFVAAVAAAATALPVFVEREAQWGTATLPVLLTFLLFLGLFTLFRLVKRNLETDRCIRRLWTVRQYFSDTHATKLAALEYPSCLVEPPSNSRRHRRWRSWQFIFGRGGGHVEIVEWAIAILTAMLAFTLARLVLDDSYSGLVAILSIVVGLLVRTTEFAWVNRRYERAGDAERTQRNSRRSL